MNTNDKYPETITFEIDHDALRQYLRARYLIGWVLGFSVVGGLGLLMAIVGSVEFIGQENLAEAVFRRVGFSISAIVALEIIAIVAYFAISHRRAAREAATLSVSVEGPYLRIKHAGGTRVDRKLHFRAISDYVVEQSNLMRKFSIASLVMNTVGGPIWVIGLRDCEAARDKLAEIDSLREN